MSVYSQVHSNQKSDSLQDATALRPTDLILYTNSWNFSSIDMYTYNINNGLYGNYGPQPDVLLNGIPVDVNFFGWQNLNMLPVFLPNVLKTESNTDLGLYKERIYPAGMFNFINQMPSDGLNLDGMVYLGNESGDPGPWIYDASRVTPNVDRWGPDAGGVFSIRENNWYERIIFIQRKHQQTDPISNRRLQRTMRNFGGTEPFYPTQTISQSGLFETGYKSKTLDFKARIIIAKDQNYLFFQPYGREIPSKASYEQIALSSSYKTNQLKFGIQYTLDNKKLNRLISDHDYIFNWNQLNSTLNGFASYAYNNFNLGGSINYENNNITAPGLFEKYYPTIDLNLNGSWFKNEKTNYLVSGGVDVFKKQTAPNIKIEFKQSLSDHWYITFNAIYSELLPIRQQSFGYWITQGYNFYEELNIPISDPLKVRNNKLASLKFLNRIDFSDKISFSASSTLTKHHTINIPWQEVNYNINTGSTPGSFTISQEEGTRFTIRVNTKHQPLYWFKQEFSMEFQTTIQGTDRYKEYFKQVPIGQIKYHLNITPVKNLNLSLQGYYRSSTEWKEFDALDGREYRDLDNLFPVFTGTYSSTAPSHLDIEIGAKKWFLDEIFSLQFTIRNLLNDEVQLHPFGATQSLMFNIKAAANF